MPRSATVVITVIYLRSYRFLLRDQSNFLLVNGYANEMVINVLHDVFLVLGYLNTPKDYLWNQPIDLWPGLNWCGWMTWKHSFLLLLWLFAWLWSYLAVMLFTIRHCLDYLLRDSNCPFTTFASLFACRHSCCHLHDLISSPHLNKQNRKSV